MFFARPADMTGSRVSASVPIVEPITGGIIESSDLSPGVGLRPVSIRVGDGTRVLGPPVEHPSVYVRFAVNGVTVFAVFARDIPPTVDASGP